MCDDETAKRLPDLLDVTCDTPAEKFCSFLLDNSSMAFDSVLSGDRDRIEKQRLAREKRQKRVLEGNFISLNLTNQLTSSLRCGDTYRDGERRGPSSESSRFTSGYEDGSRTWKHSGDLQCTLLTAQSSFCEQMGYSSI